jgi:hypothetical protein
MAAAAAKIHTQALFALCPQIAQVLSVIIFTKRAAKARIGPGSFT